MRLIDADALLEKFNRKADIWTALTDEDTAGDFAFYCKLADAVEDMPTVDAVPVVRCKDCKHYKDGRCFFTMRRHGLHDDWFCADGEKVSE